MIPTRRRIKILVKLAARQVPVKGTGAWQDGKWTGTYRPETGWEKFKRKATRELLGRPDSILNMMGHYPALGPAVKPIQRLMATSKVGPKIAPAVVKTQKAVGTGKRLTGAALKASAPAAKWTAKNVGVPVVGTAAVAQGVGALGGAPVTPRIPSGSAPSSPISTSNSSGPVSVPKPPRQKGGALKYYKGLMGTAYGRSLAAAPVRPFKSVGG